MTRRGRLSPLHAGGRACHRLKQLRARSRPRSAGETSQTTTSVHRPLPTPWGNPLRTTGSAEPPGPPLLAGRGHPTALPARRSAAWVHPASVPCLATARHRNRAASSRVADSPLLATLRSSPTVSAGSRMPMVGHPHAHTLKRNRIRSPSRTTYSFPSDRMSPCSRAALSDPTRAKSS